MDENFLNKLPKPFLEAAERKKVISIVSNTTEEDLRVKVKPDYLLNKIRLSLWRNYDKVANTTTRINMKQTLSGLCSRYELEIIMANDYKAAWILKTPTSYQSTVEEGLHRGLSRLREVLELPIQDEDGKMDLKAVSMILKVTQMFDVRVNGNNPLLIKSQIQNVPAPTSEPIQITESEARKEIKLLEKELNV